MIFESASSGVGEGYTCYHCKSYVPYGNIHRCVGYAGYAGYTGYTCINCGQWVHYQSNVAHQCPVLTPKIQYIESPDYTDLLIRITQALEKIEQHLKVIKSK